MDIKLISRDELNFVQFIGLNQEELFKVCCEKSKYLDGAVFSLFQHCFELASEDFEYYSVSSFRNNQVVSLRNHLLTNQTKISLVNSGDDLEKFALKQIAGLEFINTLKNQYVDWKISWEKIKADLLEVGEDLIEMVDNCIDEDFVLWIKGF